MDFAINDAVDVRATTLSAYTESFANVISTGQITTRSQQQVSAQAGMDLILKTLITCREKQGTVYVLGNGGSAAIASHVVIDLVNMGKMRAMAMLDPATTTCISNDYGYDKIYSKQLSYFARSEDLLIAISSSGNSKNILNAVDTAKKRGLEIITLSGFDAENALRKLGDYNLWLNSKEYGKVETGHAFILHYLTDYLRNVVCAMEEEVSA